ncbi:tubulin-specific chaperone A-like [Anneissia japonica]|uniref:tubulin-specific chaperone A-like n=1 Tax=Anneissia japonica TaxID=1529436 RepID=UPI001425B415|nr:tubulin-specific chaperone A-like [Anneissia japonica]
MASADPRLRQLKIKTGVLKRCAKEKVMYEKEADEIAAKIERMKADNKNEYDIRKQNEVLAESKMMIPDCKKRIEAAYRDLESLIEECKTDFAEMEELELAVEQLKQVTI